MPDARDRGLTDKQCPLPIIVYTPRFWTVTRLEAEAKDTQPCGMRPLALEDFSSEQLWRKGSRPSPQEHLTEILLSKESKGYISFYLFNFILRQGLSMLPKADSTSSLWWTIWVRNWLGTRVSGEHRVLFVQCSCCGMYVPTLPWSLARSQPLVFPEMPSPSCLQSPCPRLAAYCLG